MRTSIFLLLFISLITFPACHKDKPHLTPQEDKEAPQVNISAPAYYSTFMNGDTIAIKAAISDNDELHEYRIEVLNTTNNSTAMEYEDHADSKSVNIDTFFVASVTDHSDFVLTVSADDHHENTTSRTVSFHVMK